MDEFHADIPAHDEWKAAVMAGEIELDQIDTSPYLRRFGAKSVKLNAGS